MRFRFKGMIRPNMALGFNDSRRVMERKGGWMVEYLRARRGDQRMKAYFRKRHFSEKEGA